MGLSGPERPVSGPGREAGETRPGATIGLYGAARRPARKPASLRTAGGRSQPAGERLRPCGLGGYSPAAGLGSRAGWTASAGAGWTIQAGPGAVRWLRTKPRATKPSATMPEAGRGARKAHGWAEPFPGVAGKEAARREPRFRPSLPSPVRRSLGFLLPSGRGGRRDSQCLAVAWRSTLTGGLPSSPSARALPVRFADWTSPRKTFFAFCCSPRRKRPQRPQERRTGPHSANPVAVAAFRFDIRGRKGGIRSGKA